MSWFDKITDIFTPVATLVDSVHTSDEEREQLRLGFQKLRNEAQQALLDLSSKVVELESQLIAAKANIITSEANGQSWLQRNWRPITMLTFLMIVVADALGLTSAPISDRMWDLLEIGIGGYVIGRSVEKVASPVMSKLADKI